MNTSRLAHISISIFRHCRSLLFSVDAASYFLVGRHRLSFFVCPRYRVQEKHKKNERGRLPISFLMSVFVSYLGVVNTHTVFFPRLPSYIIRTNKKLVDEECVCVHTHTKKKKRRKDIHPIREWQQ
jgi:hypothetical protein